MDRLEQIRRKLDELVGKDTEFIIFGSKEPWAGHEYRLNPCKTVAELEAFEHSAGIALPGEYRQFLTEIGNGGAGPCYGLYCLNEGIDVQSHYFDDEHQDLGSFFAPFPITNEQVLNEIKADETVLDDAVCIFRREHPTTGIIFLAEYGCGGYYVLVVNGEQSGKVWFLHSDGYLNPCHINGRQFDFFDWYEHWLDTSLAEVSVKISASDEIGE